MRNFFVTGKTTLTIQMSHQGVKLTRDRTWWPKRSDVLVTHAWPDSVSENSTVSVPDLMGARLRQVLFDAECKKLPVTVVFSDVFFRMWMVTPPQNVSSFSDCQAAASSRFLSLYGETMSDWEIAADWDAGLPFLACAFPRALLQTVRDVAQEFQLTLLEILPQFIWHWNRWRKQIAIGAWFAVLDQQEFTLAIIVQNRILTLRSINLEAGSHDNKTWLCQYLKRESLRLNVPQPTQLQLCGAVPEAWLVPTTGTLLCSRLDSLSTANAKVDVVDGQCSAIHAIPDANLQRKQG